MTATRLRLVMRGETNPETVGTPRIEVIRKLLSPYEITPRNVRFVPPDEEHSDGTMEQSYDGGETWIANPAIDPRHSTAYQFPPRGEEGNTTRCDAAENLIGALHTVIDILISAPDTISAINSWLAYVKHFIPEIGFIITILQYIHDLLASLTPYLEDAFTEEVYDGIKCLTYNRMDGNGALNATALGDLIGDICAAYEETVCTVCQAILQTWWAEVGCTNAAAVGSLVGDCAECCGDIQVIYPWSNIDSSTNGYNDCAISPPNCVWRAAYIGYVSPIGYTTEFDIVIDLGEVRTVTGLDYAGAFTGIANAMSIMTDDGSSALGQDNPPAGYETGGTIVLGETHETRYLWLKGQATDSAPSERHCWLVQATIHYEC